MEQHLYANCTGYCSACFDCSCKANVQPEPKNCCQGLAGLLKRWEKVAGGKEQLKRVFGEKGQVEAPFELLVAVIIMGFVIAVGLYAMNYLGQEKCRSEVDFELDELRQELELVVANPLTSREVFFNIPGGCFPEKGQEIRIKDWANPDLCVSYCHTAVRLCTLLEYDAPALGTNPGYGTKICVNIPSDTVFPASYGGKCDLISDDYELVDLSVEIPEGTYLLINKSSGTDTFPTICAYRKLTS